MSGGGAITPGFSRVPSLPLMASFSGSVLRQLADELDGYTMTKSSLHFDVDGPLPKAVVKKLIAARLADAPQRSH
jgi:hypothetical protein